MKIHFQCGTNFFFLVSFYYSLQKKVAFAAGKKKKGKGGRFHIGNAFPIPCFKFFVRSKDP